MDIESKLETIEQDFLDIEKRMADPAVAVNPKDLQSLGKKRAQLEPVVEKFRSYRAARRSVADAVELQKSGDPEMETLADEEIERLTPLIDGFEA